MRCALMLITHGWRHWDHANTVIRHEANNFVFMARMARNNDARLFREPINVDGMFEMW